MSRSHKTIDPGTKAIRAGVNIALGWHGDRIGKETPMWELVQRFVRRQVGHIRRLRSRT